MLNPSGLTLLVKHSDGTTETVTSGFSCAPECLEMLGATTITVSYKDMTAIFQVTVTEKGIVLYGDVDGDGSVTQKDVTELLRLLANGDVTLPAAKGNPDANADGSVNLKDTTILRRYLSGGWGVNLP